MLPPPSVEKFKDVYMVLDRMDTVSFFFTIAQRPALDFAGLSNVHTPYIAGTRYVNYREA